MLHGSWIRRAVVDLACGALLAFLVLRLFGVSGQSDVNPPVCTNASGNVIDCGADTVVRAVALVVLVAVPALLLAVQARRVRRSRRGDPGQSTRPSQAV